MGPPNGKEYQYILYQRSHFNVSRRILQEFCVPAGKKRKKQVLAAAALICYTKEKNPKKGNNGRKESEGRGTGLARAGAGESNKEADSVKRIVFGVLLILLGLTIFARIYLPGTELSFGSAAAPAVTQTPEAAETPTPTPEPLPEVQPTPAPTPEPTPEPTPAPTPRPLNAPELTDRGIDESFFGPAGQQGTLLTDVTYITHDYVYGRDGDYVKPMHVYLPYGYSESERYDVLFLLHIRQNDVSFWLEKPHDYNLPEGGSVAVDVVNVLDNLIERGLCKPMIVIALDGYLNDESRWVHNSDQVYPQFAEEFGRDILPFVAEHYATWADGTDRAQLAAAREHFGVLGASFGAYQAELSVLAPNFDLVSWYTLTGGGSVSSGYLMPMWTQYGTLDQPISLLYFEEGEFDDFGPVEGSYLTLSDWTEKFTRDENLRYQRVLGAGHDQREWVNALFNSAQLFFR